MDSLAVADHSTPLTPAPNAGVPAGLPGFVDRVRRVLRDCLERGNPNIDRVAESMGMSARSLQRRLREAGTSHRILLDELRRDLAAELAADGASSRRSLARALAYGNSRSLWRAIRRFGPELVERWEAARASVACARG